MTNFRHAFQDLGGLPSPFLMRAANGYHYHLRSIGTPKEKLWKAPDHGKYLVHQPLRSFALWLYKWQKMDEVPNRWMLPKPGIVAVIFLAWSTDSKLATDFWGHVFLEDHPQRDDVSRELCRILAKWKSGSEKRDQSMYFRQCSSAWTTQWRKRSKG